MNFTNAGLDRDSTFQAWGKMSRGSINAFPRYLRQVSGIGFSNNKDGFQFIKKSARIPSHNNLFFDEQKMSDLSLSPNETFYPSNVDLPGNKKSFDAANVGPQPSQAGSVNVGDKLKKKCPTNLTNQVEGEETCSPGLKGTGSGNAELQKALSLEEESSCSTSSPSKAAPESSEMSDVSKEKETSLEISNPIKITSFELQRKRKKNNKEMKVKRFRII